MLDPAARRRRRRARLADDLRAAHRPPGGQRGAAARRHGVERDPAGLDLHRPARARRVRAGRRAVLILGLGRLLADPATADILLHRSRRSSSTLRPDLETPLRPALRPRARRIRCCWSQSRSMPRRSPSASSRASHRSGRSASPRRSPARGRRSGGSSARGSSSGWRPAMVALAVSLPFGGVRANTGVSFIASMIGALAVTPWAFAGAGIVLGDVGAVEALRRSVALYRARPDGSRSSSSCSPSSPRPSRRSRSMSGLELAAQVGALLRDRAGPGRQPASSCRRSSSSPSSSPSGA